MRHAAAMVVAMILILGAFVNDGVAQAPGDPPASLRGPSASGALGFHNTQAPLGFRWWAGSHRYGLDAALGYTTTPSLLFDDESLATWTVDGGVPITMRRWDKVALLFRPGILHQGEQVERPGSVFTTETVSTVSITAEFEAEVFLADRFSVSAAHGIAFNSLNRPGVGRTTTFGTTGGNFTAVGFHVYFVLDGK